MGKKTFPSGLESQKMETAAVLEFITSTSAEGKGCNDFPNPIP